MLFSLSSKPFINIRVNKKNLKYIKILGQNWGLPYTHKGGNR